MLIPTPLTCWSESLSHVISGWSHYEYSGNHQKQHAFRYHSVAARSTVVNWRKRAQGSTRLRNSAKSLSFEHSWGYCHRWTFQRRYSRSWGVPLRLGPARPALRLRRSGYPPPKSPCYRCASSDCALVTVFLAGRSWRRGSHYLRIHSRWTVGSPSVT